MLSDQDLRGNIFIYCFFQISNICLFVIGLFTICISIYLVALSKALNYFNSLFFIFGIIFGSPQHILDVN